MGDTYVISGLREKRSAIAGEIVDLRRDIDRLQAELFHIDAVLKIYGEEPSEIPTKGRMPKRSAYFGRSEISRRCYNFLREHGETKADAIAAQAMRDKGLDPLSDKKMRADFTKRFLVTLHDLKNNGTVEKIGDLRNVRWRLKSDPTDDAIENDL